LFNDLLPEFELAELVLANLECPLVERLTPILKTGPNFGEPTDCIKGVQQAGIDILNVGNNHILDQGAQGLKSTLEVCKSAGVSTVGAGENLECARRILVLPAGGLRVGFLSMAEQEFSIATKTTAGANPLDLMDFVRNTRERRADYDYLVVLLHGAHEFQPITPRIQNTCRFLIEMGANAVMVQHPHSLGGYENYRGGHIVYGQGALLMDEAIYRDLPSFHEGILVKLNLESDSTSTMELIPFRQSDPEPGARRMRPEQEGQFLKRLTARSEQIMDPAFVEAEWMQFCESNEHSYRSIMFGFGRILARLNRGGAVERWFPRKRALLQSKNLACCETHREAVETIIRRLSH
jgi:poly-gamma-glutamate synthesis protein (capsule biosynthesis protein)